MQLDRQETGPSLKEHSQEAQEALLSLANGLGDMG